MRIYELKKRIESYFCEDKEVVGLFYYFNCKFIKINYENFNLKINKRDSCI